MKLPNIFKDRTTVQQFAPGEIIFAKGDSGDSMFTIESGEVELSVDGAVVEIVGPDGFFGEMALIEKEPRSATATAKSECVLMPINDKRFEFMVHETPFFAMHVLKGLSRRLRGKVTKE
jgi:CRP/FNR family transcriptional regulator, cyclic AMP receptor protein